MSNRRWATLSCSTPLFETYAVNCWCGEQSLLLCPLGIYVKYPHCKDRWFTDKKQSTLFFTADDYIFYHIDRKDTTWYPASHVLHKIEFESLLWLIHFISHFLCYQSTSILHRHCLLFVILSYSYPTILIQCLGCLLCVLNNLSSIILLLVFVLLWMVIGKHDSRPQLISLSYINQNESDKYFVKAKAEALDLRWSASQVWIPSAQAKKISERITMFR